MKHFFIFFIFMPLLSTSQELKSKIYSNPNVGFSITLNTDWEVVKEEVEWQPIVFYNSAKNEQINIALVPAPDDIKFNYTSREAEAVKSVILVNLQSGKGGNVTVDSIWAYPGNFLGNKCIVVEINCSDPEMLKGVKINYKSVQFIHNRHLLNIITCIPLLPSSVFPLLAYVSRCIAVVWALTNDVSEILNIAP